MNRNIRIAIILLVLAALSFGCGGGRLSQNIPTGQSPQTDDVTQSLQAPIMGFAYATGTTELRTMVGVPGASAQASPFTLSDSVTGIDFAPGQESAIAEQTNNAPLAVIPFVGADPGPLVPISGAISKADIIAFSPSGAFAALYSAAEGRLQVVAGLPNTPALIRTLGSGDLPDTVRTLALADDGLTLVEGTVHSAVYLLASSGPQLIANASDLGGLVFTPKSTNALLFDRSGGNLSLLQNVSSTVSNHPLASGLTGLNGNTILATDGHRAVITSANSNVLWEVDLRSLQTQNLQLPVPAVMLEPLRTPGDYLLSWQPGQLAWIVDTNQAKGAVYFVPAKAVTQSAQVQ